MRNLVAVFVMASGLAACGNRSSPLPTAPELSGAQIARNYVNEVVDVMQAHSFKRKSVDWTVLRAEALTAAGSATTIETTAPGILRALALLNDSHSQYQPAPGSRGTSIGYFSKQCSFAKIPNPAVPADIGYVRVSSFSGSSAQSLAFADSVLAQVRAADRDGLVGWIVDLRGNTGGNMWPMLAGLGPILGDGLVGYFKDPDGVLERWDIRLTSSLYKGDVFGHTSEGYALRSAAPRVAVLVDRGVMSSGEATFIAFRGRPNTRSFGLPSCGLSTAVAGHTLSDAATLFLAESTMADRSGLAYGDQVVPDEIIDDVVSGAVNRAIAWLRGS